MNESSELARRHGLTSYDVAYLFLAIEKKMPLATQDKRLLAAAEKEGVEVFSGKD